MRVAFAACRSYLFPVRRLLTCLMLVFSTVMGLSAESSTGRVMKVLPHLLDLEGRHSLSPSLYERDAYQAFLRQHPEKRSGIRFDVHWKNYGPPFGALKLRLELRGIAAGDVPRQLVLEKPVEPGGLFGHWTSFLLTGAAYHDFGEVTAWRVTLLDDEQVVGELKSFLW